MLENFAAKIQKIFYRRINTKFEFYLILPRHHHPLGNAVVVDVVDFEEVYACVNSLPDGTKCTSLASENQFLNQS